MSQLDPSNPYARGYPQHPYEPTAPAQYGAPQLPPKGPGRARPTSVTVIAVIGIVIGAYAVLCTPFSLVGFFMPRPQPAPQAGGLLAILGTLDDVVRGDPTLLSGTLAILVADILVGLALLTGCIGSLGLRPWARGLMIGYAVLEMVLALAGLVFNAGFVAPKLGAALAGTGDPLLGQAVPAMRYLFVLPFLFSLILPICILIFFTRRRVKVAFAGPEPPGYGP